MFARVDAEPAKRAVVLSAEGELTVTYADETQEVIKDNDMFYWPEC